MKSTLEKRILLFAFLTLTLTITVNTGFNIEGFRRDYRDGIVLRCQSLAAGLKSSIEKVLALGLPLEEMEGLSIRCQEIVVTDPEIAYALIENEVGNPLYSSDPSFHFTSEIQFLASLTPSVAILKSQRGLLYDVSMPIYAADGKLVGRIRTGFLDSILEERTGRAFRRALAVLGSAFVLVFGLIFLFIRRDLVGPIGRLCSVAKQIASGDFKIAVPAMPNRDFDELGTALREMAASLQSRDDKIQEGYQELEVTNRELQDSYEHQEQISAELRRSREMYRSLLEDANDAIVVSDEEDQIVLVNKAAEAFFGFSRQQVEGANLFTTLEKLQSSDIEGQYALHQQVLRGNNVEAEIRFVRPTDLRQVVGWALASSIVGNNGRRMVQAVYRDVTRERQVKENLENSARELERLNQMKDSFLGVASHELKTPLTVIIGYAELILSEMSSKVDQSVLPMVQHIADAGERLSTIVKDMIDVSMLDSKRLPLRSRDVDINTLIEDAVRELGFFFSLRKQSLKTNLGTGLPLTKCDPDRMIQAISNLVGNAIKFTPDGGSIYIETRVVKSLRSPRPVNEEEGIKEIETHLSPYIEIIVRDTGIGIAERDQLHVFDKFYEVGKIEEHFTGKTAFKGKGTGLGLTLVKGIVDIHGGEIWVESPGCDPRKCPGSAFHILLPVKPVEDEEDFFDQGDA